MLHLSKLPEMLNFVSECKAQACNSWRENLRAISIDIKKKDMGKNIKEKKRNPFNKTTKLNNKRCDVITLRSVIISSTGSEL